VDDEFFCLGDINLINTMVCDYKEVQSLKKKILKEDFDFAFIYFDGLDATGHTFTWGSQEYEDQIGNVDGYVGEIIEALESKGILQDTYIVVVSDHGGTLGTKEHGGQNNDNLLVPWIIYGPNIKQNYELNSLVHNIDTMPTIFKALGLESSPFWRGKIIKEAFLNL